MPISAVQSDPTAPEPRRKGRVELLAADPTDDAYESIRQPTGDQSITTADESADEAIEATEIGANGSLAASVRELLPPEAGLSVPVPTTGDAFALDELLEEFPEPPADLLRQVADPSLSYDGLGLDGATAADQLAHDDDQRRAVVEARGAAQTHDPGVPTLTTRSGCTCERSVASRS